MTSIKAFCAIVLLAIFLIDCAPKDATDAVINKIKSSEELMDIPPSTDVLIGMERVISDSTIDSKVRRNAIKYLISVANNEASFFQKDAAKLLPTQIQYCISLQEIEGLKSIYAIANKDRVKHYIIWGIGTMFSDTTMSSFNKDQAISFLCNIRDLSFDLRNEANDALLKASRDLIIHYQKLFLDSCMNALESHPNRYKAQKPFIIIIDGEILSDSLGGKTPSDIDRYFQSARTVIIANSYLERVGTYEPSGAPAHIVHFDVGLYDLAANKKVASKDFSGGQPPRQVLSGGAKGSDPDISSIKSWVESLSEMKQNITVIDTIPE